MERKINLLETLDPADAGTGTVGGGDRNRTDDLLLAKQALSQLSYAPVSEVRCQKSDYFFLF